LGVREILVRFQALRFLASLCGANIRVVQELMGHADVKTTEIYTHVMQKDLRAVVSPPGATGRPA
jgi:site-specific recombinase XerD